MRQRKASIWAGAAVILIASGATLAWALAAPQAAPPLIKQDRILAGSPFVDNFSSLDRGKWSVSSGWSNGPYMVNDWQASQSKFGAGLTLMLAAKKSGKHPFSSGEVQSRELFGHGYYETRMQAATGSGVVTGFFTYTGPPFGQPWNEIDVEILGAKPKEILLTYFYKGDKVSHVHKVDFDATQSLHNYAFDWQPGKIEWFVDGNSVHQVDGAELPLPDRAQKLMMHIWASETLTDWVGPFDASVLPVAAQFSCVAYERRKPDKLLCR